MSNDLSSQNFGLATPLADVQKSVQLFEFEV